MRAAGCSASEAAPVSDRQLPPPAPRPLSAAGGRTIKGRAVVLPSRAGRREFSPVNWR